MPSITSLATLPKGIRRRLVTAVIMSLMLLTGGAGGLPAGQLYVCGKSGSDAAAGTSRDAALQSLAEAIERASPGTIVTLLPGWHTGGVALKAGQPGKPITVRGERRGRVFIGEPAAVLTGWQRADGLNYSYAAAVKEPPRTVIEASTGVELRALPSLVDVEHLAGTYYYDKTSLLLYVHPSDSESALRHLYSISPAAGTGIILGDHTVVEDLVFTGFGDAAIRGNSVTGAEVRNCIAYGNGYGIELRGGTDCVIRGNHLWGNVPRYASGSQIYITRCPARRVASGLVIEDNRVYGSSRQAIRFYTADIADCLLRNNFMSSSHSKGIDPEGFSGVGNVSLSTFWAGLGGHNTYAQSPRPQTVKDTDLLSGQKDWHFADPAHFDFRLQADSPARGAAPDGTDLGAHQYAGSVVFVSPHGDDAAPGTSVRTAWRSLRHAAQTLKPGQTLYIEPGEWAGEHLILEGIEARVDDPVRIRVRGKGSATVAAVAVTGCRNLSIEGLTVAGTGAAIEVYDSTGITLEGCAVVHLAANDGGGTPALAITGSSRISIDRCGVASDGPEGVLISDSTDVEVVSSVLLAYRGVALRLAGDTAGFWSDMNAFAADDESAGLIATPEAVFYCLSDWQEGSGLDEMSIVVPVADFPAVRQGDFSVEVGHPASFRGRYMKPMGPAAPALPLGLRQAIERVEVVSTTRTSANLTWWTPGRITGTIIEWGTTPEYGTVHDRAQRARGEYETFHSASLLGLEPETTYHFRVGFRDHGAIEEDDDDEHLAPLVWSKDYSFTTAAVDPAPRELFVAVDGSDDNDGLSPDSPWRTVRHAARHAGAGDTVTLAPGRYQELLMPLQTGTGPDARLTFRAARPLTVFLDAGFSGDGSGRSHAAQVMNKGFVTLENLAFEKAALHDNGGYRGWPGYAGLVRLSGSSGIEIKGCVMDGRHRYMVGLVAEGVGTLPGVPPDTPPLTVTDCVFIGNWYAVYIGGRGVSRLEHNAFARSRLLKGAFSSETRIRNSIYQSLGANKWGSNLFAGMDNMDSDFNCFGWDDDNQQRVVAFLGSRPERIAVRGLAEWQEAFGQDANSIEAEPGYPLSTIVGFGGRAMPGPPHPFRIEDVILPADSPCRGAGEGGADVGPRWEQFLD